MLERIEELKQRVRETPLLERLAEARSRIGGMCSEGRPPRMCIPVQYDDDDFYISTTLSDAQATIADLQGQVKAAQAERDEQGQLKARLNRDYNLLQNEHLKLYEKVKQEAVYTKQVEIERDALQQRVAQLAEKVAHYDRWLSGGVYYTNAEFEEQINDRVNMRNERAALKQRVAQLEGESKALVDAHRDFKVHLSHCNFGEHAQVCKYGREETCPALTPSWVWFGNALQRSEALQADHARLLGLVRALPVVRGNYSLTVTITGPTRSMEIADAVEALLTYRASLPAQPAQGGA